VRAVVLAAGYATRLRPYTTAFPKTLLRVAGKPLLDATVRSVLDVSEVESLTIVTNHRFYPWFLEWRRSSSVASHGGKPVEVLDDGTNCNDQRLGSVGDLILAMDQQNSDDDMLVVCSDKVFTFDLKAMVAMAHERRAIVNVCQDVGDPSLLARRHGCLVLDRDDRVTEFLEKPENPPTSIKSIAFYVYPRHTLNLIRDYGRSSANQDAPGFLAKSLCRRTAMYGWRIDGECLDVGNPESYRSVNDLCWQRENGIAFREARVLVRALDSADRLDYLLAGLEAAPNVSLIWLELPGAAESHRWEQGLAQAPTLVPVNILTAADRDGRSLARELECNWIFELGEGVRSFDFSRLASEDASILRPVVVGLSGGS
jgi:glucose-1-phosphate thymidylyltransferase